MQGFVDGKLPEDNKVIINDLSKSSFEVESVEVVKDTDGKEDSLFEIKVLPNRIADAMSIRGMARELGAVYNFKETQNIPKMDLSIYNLNNDYVSTPPTGQGETMPLNIFTGMKVEFDNSIETPAWIKEILEKSGGRSINCLVDITNMMLFCFGQPAHVFDFNKLNGGIVTRFANEGEEMELLDGKKVILKSSDFVIADESRSLAVAGIKGGKLAEVDKNTKMALFEMANFNPTMIRKTSQHLNLRTDASKIFENGITTFKTEDALNILVATVLDIDKNAKIEFIINKKINEVGPDWVDLKFADINNFAGKSIPKEEVVNLLKRQNFQVEVDGENLKVKAEECRTDINISEDVVEEVLRLYGFDNIESKPLNLQKNIEHNPRFLFENYLKIKLESKGFTEVFNYTFVDKGDVKVKLGIASDKEHLRNNLLDGAKNSFTKNYNYLPILETDIVKFFEVGTVFSRDADGKEIEEKRCIMVCDDNKKKTKYLPELENILKEIEEELKIEKIVAITSSEKPAMLEFSVDKIVNASVESLVDFVEISKNLQDIKYSKISIYPFIVRDVACWLPPPPAPTQAGGEKSLSFENLKADIEKMNLVNLQKLYMFDSFTKKDENGIEKTSIAFRLIFQSYEKTLTDTEVESEMQKVYTYLKENNFEIR